MTDPHPLRRRPHHQPPARPLVPGGIVAIALVFALGASLAVPMPVGAQAGTATLKGVVADPDGIPIPGVIVEIRQAVAGDLYHYRQTTTNDDGTYQFANLDGGAWTVVARQEKHRTNETSVTVNPGAAKTFDIILAPLSTSYYTGTVYDGETGTVLGGATIAVTGYGPAADGARRETTSASDGSFRVQLFAGENQILITKGGYGPYHDWIYNPDGDIQREIHLYERPDQTATLRVRVVDEANKPVQAWIDMHTDWSRQPEERVVAGSGGSGSSEPASSPVVEPDYCYGCGGGNYNSNSTATDANGRLTMKAYPGSVVVTANRVGYLTNTQYTTLPDGRTTELTFTLVKLPARTVTLSGTVTDAKTGDPVPGASVSVQVPDAADYQWAQTDNDGRFSVQVRPGYTMIEVHAEYWGPIIMEAEAAEDRPADDDGENGAKASPAIAPAPRPSDGSGKRYLPLVTILRTADGDTPDVALALKPKPAAQSLLVGYVLDQDTGEAVPGAHISLQNHETGDWGDTTTDENGSFRFHLYGGYHTVRVWMDGYLPYSVNVEIPDKGTTRQDLTIVPGSYASEGWWDPDGGYYGHGGGYATPAIDHAEEGSYAPGMSTTTASAPSPSKLGSDGDDRGASSGASSGNIRGEAGGLPAYDPAQKGSTFGLDPEGGAAAESPLGGMLLITLVVGCLALVVGRRRHG